MGQQVSAAPSVNPREMKKMETDIESLAEEYRNLQTSRQQLEDDIIRSGIHAGSPCFGSAKN
jgi:hypothetical protein